METSPIPPLCWTVPEQLQPPPAASVHVTEEYPRTVKKLEAPSQVTGVDDTTRHDEVNVNCSLPDVVVLSE